MAEGNERAFGLAVPRDMHVVVRFPDAVYAEGPVGFEALSNYVRARVSAERVETGPAKTVFLGARIKGDVQHRIQVEVTDLGGKAEIIVRDQTPKPDPEPGLSEKERWRRAGVGEDGKVVKEQAE